MRNTERAYMEKLAAARWRTMIRAGQLGEGAMAEMRNMGLHGTPEAYAREATGLQRGSEALKRRHDIAEVSTTPAHEFARAIASSDGRAAPGYNPMLHSGASTMAFNPAEVVSDARSAFDRVMAPHKARSMTGWRRFIPSALQPPPPALRRAAARASEEAATAATATARVHPMIGLGNSHAPAGALPSSPEFAGEQLTRRHEVDEARNMLRFARKGKNPMRAEAMSSHVSPRVTMEEAGHSNFLNPGGATMPEVGALDTPRGLADFRARISGEGQAMAMAMAQNQPNASLAMHAMRRPTGTPKSWAPAPVAAPGTGTADVGARAYRTWWAPPGAEQNRRVRESRAAMAQMGR